MARDRDRLSGLLDVSERWLRVPRSFFDPQNPFHPHATGEEACKAFAIWDLVAYARWRTSDGLKRGQMRASERFLARRWNWPRSRAQRFLRRLEEDGVIRRCRSRGRQAGTIEIVDYDRLQATPSNRKETGKAERNSVHKSSRKNTGGSEASGQHRTATRTGHGTAPLTVSRSKEEGRIQLSYQRESDHAREEKEDDERRLCPECEYVEIEADRDRCTRCDRLATDVEVVSEEDRMACPSCGGGKPVDIDICETCAYTEEHFGGAADVTAAQEPGAGRSRRT